MPNRIRTQPREIAARRGVGYAFLAHCLAEPSESNAIALNEAAHAAAFFLDGTSLGVVAREAAQLSPDEFAAGFHTVFGLGASPDCPMFESAYFPGEAIGQTERMADVAGFYQAFGVESVGWGRRPDDACTELEFMAYLCRKQIHAAGAHGAPRVAQVLRAERMFLVDHLRQWAPLLGQRMAEHAPAGSVFALVGRALGEWIEADCVLIGAVQPQPDSCPLAVMDEPAAPARAADLAG